MRRRTASALALCVGLVVLAGCGDSPGYDASAVEKYLVSSQGWRFAGSGEVTKASCPADRDLSEGMKVTCTVTVSGSKVPFVVTLTDVDQDKVTIKAAPDGVVIPTARLKDVVSIALDQNSRKANVDCGGSAFLVAKVGKTVECKLVMGSQSKTFKVTVKDETGRVSIAA